MSDEFDDLNGPDDDDDEDHPLPLDRQEAARIRRDLEDLLAFRQTFEPEGFKGVSLYCPDCDEDHYYEWDMLENNLQALLESGETPVHEPAFEPKPDEYINWEYALGYLDGLADAGVPLAPVQLTDTGGCPFCGAELPSTPSAPAYCPTCGTHLGPARIARSLLDRGWPLEDVTGLLRSAGLPALRTLPAPAADEAASGPTSSDDAASGPADDDSDG